MRSREPQSSKLLGPDRKQGPRRESQWVETWRADLEPLGETTQQGLVLGARGCHSVRAPVSPPQGQTPPPSRSEQPAEEGEASGRADPAPGVHRWETAAGDTPRCGPWVPPPRPSHLRSPRLRPACASVPSLVTCERA